MAIYVRLFGCMLVALCCTSLFLSVNASTRGLRVSYGKRLAEPRPYQVQIYAILDDGEALCSGTILNEYWILTAAHCFPSGTRRATVVTNERLDATNREEFYEVEGFGRHMSYVKTPYNPHSHLQFVNDIAVIKLKRPIKFVPGRVQSAAASGVQLGGVVKPGDIVSIAGWGRNEHEENNLYPLAVDARVASNAVCTKAKEEFAGVEKRRFGEFQMERMFCTLPVSSTKFAAPCRGDSGSPVLHKNRIVGIVSHGNGRPICPTNQPEFYTRVEAYVDWIEKTINGKRTW